MDELMARFWSDLIHRATGPMMFRFILQPLMSIFYAYRDGLHDAHAGRPPYLHTIIYDRAQRGDLLREGFRAVARVMTLGVVMDTIFQIVMFRRIYPLELVVIVLMLAFVPYLLLRGPISRVLRHRTHA